ncbi:MAG: MBL fold metallo-hydrolase [Chitinophagaceae bacterium]
MLEVRSFTFNPLAENTYVIYNEERHCLIIDPGCYFENERRELREFIEKYALSPKLLLNTHCHLDHVFGNDFVHKTYGLTLHIHEKEKPVFDYAPSSGNQWGFPFKNYEGPLIYIRGAEEISLGEDKLKILFTPGHAPGHVCFYNEKQGFIIGGDVLFRQSIGRTDLPLGDHVTLLASIREQLFVLPDETVVYSGHGPATTIGYEKKHNPFL